MTEFPVKIPQWELEFSRTALAKNIDNSIPEDLIPNALRLAYWLQDLRNRLCAHYGKDTPIIVTSGYRSSELNAILPGASKTSMHPEALAADIRVPGVTPRELVKFIKRNMVFEKYDQVIDEFGRWTHVGLARDGEEPRMQLMAAEKINGKTHYRRLS